MTTERLMTVEEYAIDLVCSGATSHAEDDLNESEQIADSDHDDAVGLALEISRAIRANPDVVLNLLRTPRDLPGGGG